MPGELTQNVIFSAFIDLTGLRIRHHNNPYATWISIPLTGNGLGNCVRP